MGLLVAECTVMPGGLQCRDNTQGVLRPAPCRRREGGRHVP